MAATGDAAQPPAQTFPDTASESEWQPVHVSSCTSQEAPGPTAALAQPCPAQSYQIVHQWPAVAGVGALPVGEVSSSQAASSEGTRSALRTASGQRKGKAERKRAMQSSQSQTCHAMKATQTDLDGHRLDKVLMQNEAHLNIIHQVTRWMPCFLVAVLFVWPLLMVGMGQLRFSQALEAHRKDILDWQVKQEECDKLSSKLQIAQVELGHCKHELQDHASRLETCEYDFNKTRGDTEVLIRSLADAMAAKINLVGRLQEVQSKHQTCEAEVKEQHEASMKCSTSLAALDKKCKHDLETGKAEYLHSIRDHASQLEACEYGFNKTWGEKELLNRSLADAMAAKINLVGSLQEVQSEHQTCEAEIEIARGVEIKLSSKLADAILSQDFLKASHGSFLRELAKRADETDKMVKQWRDMRSQNLKTLHHGLHWMWKFENQAKQNNQLMEAVKELEASPAKEAWLMLLAAVFSSGKSKS